jgi:hypothetical protein
VQSTKSFTICTIVHVGEDGSVAVIKSRGWTTITTSTCFWVFARCPIYDMFGFACWGMKISILWSYLTTFNKNKNQQRQGHQRERGNIAQSLKL